ncbi:MAG: phosphate signaling complex protein PhoU [Pseudomonadota bacterium]|nr:phosphate signaling complex protein PhoU [Pseudomonadota bacterium]
MAQHIVTSFEDDLIGLARSIAEMGGHAEQLVERSITALLRSNPDLAHEVIAADKKVDALHRHIEERAILVIARRQPLAQDLRETVAAIRIASDLERIGDLGKNIAKRAIAIQSQSFSQKVRVGVEHLAELGLRQVKTVLDAYATRDLVKTQEVCAKDEEIDAVYNSLFRELLTYMMEDPRTISMCTHLLFCAKNIERIGDHATNIAETVHYLITGQQWSEPRQSSTRVDI